MRAFVQVYTLHDIKYKYQQFFQNFQFFKEYRFDRFVDELYIKFVIFRSEFHKYIFCEIYFLRL